MNNYLFYIIIGIIIIIFRSLIMFGNIKAYEYMIAKNKTKN